jgi:ABC-type phosphate/phosphonate transport system substrate-binding protein
VPAGSPNSESRKKTAGRESAPRGGPFSDRGIWAPVWLVLLLATVTVPGQNQAPEPDHPFRFGFSASLMQEVNEADSRAAMKVWAETLVKDGTVRGNPDVLFCPDLATMVTALQNRLVDGVAAPTTEFLALRERVKFNRYVFGVTGGNLAEEYVLLVHKDSGLTELDHLRGRSLNVLKHSRTCLAIPWLDTLLLDKGLNPVRDFCGRVTEESKLTKAVLPVFFRKADACLVTLKGFKTMSELNPQVSRQMRVLASSPEFIPAAFFFRAGYPQAQQDQYVAEFTRVHATPAGQQILTVFQTERLEEHPASVLDRTFALLESHRRLLGGTNRLSAAGVETRLVRREVDSGGK